jgi:RNA polymerase sigma-70 factor (ECF subfamily)
LDITSDADLIIRIRAGDSDAAAALVRRYYNECWRFAYGMIGHRADAEDAVQETFLRMLGALDRYTEQQRFRGWLFRILANECRTVLTYQRRMSRFASDTEGIQSIAKPNETGHETFKQSPEQFAEMLREALCKLPDRHREAFLLKHAEQMEYGQMADITGASISALKMRVKRACAMLRSLLEEKFHD